MRYISFIYLVAILALLILPNVSADECSFTGTWEIQRQWPINVPHPEEPKRILTVKESGNEVKGTYAGGSFDMYLKPGGWYEGKWSGSPPTLPMGDSCSKSSGFFSMGISNCYDCQGHWNCDDDPYSP